MGKWIFLWVGIIIGGWVGVIWTIFFYYFITKRENFIKDRYVEIWQYDTKSDTWSKVIK
jgi:hypothetical protein